MAENSGKLISEQLDEMALKIMMVEPGDLSVVGELVVLVEGLQELNEIGQFPNISKMGKELEDVLGKIVMMDLPDSAVITSVGNLPQVMSDFSDKVGFFSETAPSQMEWKLVCFHLTTSNLPSA